MSLNYNQYLLQISRELTLVQPVYAISTASGNGTSVTITYVGGESLQVGAYVTVKDVVPAAYNGTYPITASTYFGGLGTVTFLSTATGAYVSGGIVGLDDRFVNAVQSIIDYAELRILRDLQLLNTTTSNTTFFTVSNNYQLDIPQGTFINIQNINILDALPPLRPVSKEYIYNVWGPAASTGRPEVYCLFGGDVSSPTTTPYVLLFGPTPNSAYHLNIVGTVRPTSIYVLGQTNPFATTFISSQFPDLFLMASMVYISGYQRNFGRQSDDPSQAVSYESQYATLLKSCMLEEAQKKFEASGWSSMPPATVATPNR